MILEDVCVCVQIGKLTDTLVTICIDQFTIRSIGIRPHTLEELLSHETTRVLCGMVGQKFIGEHVGSKSERHSRVGGRIVVGVGGNRVLFAVVGVLCKHLGSDEAVGFLIGEVEELLEVLCV